MAGKNKCKILKRVRREIAEANDIPLEIPECTYEGDCPGVCPRCEEELTRLMEEIEWIRAGGGTVAIPQVPLTPDEQTAAEASGEDEDGTEEETRDPLSHCVGFITPSEETWEDSEKNW